jgi:hypothetical protein
VTLTLLLANKYQPRNLAPVLTLPARNYLIGAHIVTMIRSATSLFSQRSYRTCAGRAISAAPC